jgi:hypothetical protein
MTFMLMKGYFWSYNEFSCILAICPDNFQSFFHLPLFVLIKDKVVQKVRYHDKT